MSRIAKKYPPRYPKAPQPIHPTSLINWHPVSEGLPDDDIIVLVACPDDYSEPVWIGYHTTDEFDGRQIWRTVEGAEVRVTHWMQFPEPPKL